MALQDIADSVLASRDIIGYLPQKGTDFSSEIACYSLPYGGLGFVSHILTYYTIVCLWNGISPLWPRRRVHYSTWDICLAVLSLLGSSGMAIFTLARCRNKWQLLTIGVWKLSISLVNGIIGINVAALVSRGLKEHQQEVERRRAEAPLWQRTRTTSEAIPEIEVSETSAWVALYIPGMLAGITGLMSLVVQNWDIPALRKLTIAFYTIVGIGLVVSMLVALNMARKLELEDGMETIWDGVFASFEIFLVLAALYSDWALGIMAHNLTGVPSGDNAAFFWTYFVAKRLTMLSW